jgi:hypothetical protein
LLLCAPASYSRAATNTLVVGQETYGWSWTKNLRKDFPLYDKDYDFRDLESLADFFKNDDSVDALQWGYDQFDFANRQPRTASSPFWTAFRDIQKRCSGSVMWTNLSKCDFEGGSVLQLQEPHLKDFISIQAQLILGELEALKPQNVIFFTGPDYDHLLEMVFPRAKLEVASGQVLQVSHESLPTNSFRTYHPAYLRRSRQWGVLDDLLSLLIS